MDKKCVLINCFATSNELRIEPVRDVFDDLGYQTIYLSSDFHHAKKQHISSMSGVDLIHVLGYKRNLSVLRLLSHFQFAKKVYKFLIAEKPDVVYVKFPPNSLVKYIYLFKKKNNCKVIFDVFDLWPESLPISDTLNKLLFPLTCIWKNKRDRYLHCGDLFITECNMYKSFLPEQISSKCRTIYLTKKDIDYSYHNKNKLNELKLCYLGGINNLIDLDEIGNIIKELKTKVDVSLDIIGDGINKDKFIDLANCMNCKVYYHGVIYDETKKYNIMKHCDLGLNIMKTNVCVALTLKSIDYLRAGLGLISNIPYDTEQIIMREGCGIISNQIGDFDINKIQTIKSNARKVYEEYFSYEKCKNDIRELIKTIDI